MRLAEKGYITGGCKRNKDYLDDKMVIEKSSAKVWPKSPSTRKPPAACSSPSANDMPPNSIDDLHAAGVTAACEIGYATSQQKPWVRLV